MADGRRHVPSSGQGSAGNPGGGLPFAGIPSELQAGVDKLLADEPEHPDPTVPFSYQKAGEDAEKLSLRGLVLKHWQLGLLAAGAGRHHQRLQPGRPALISIGINRGLGAHKSMGVIIVVSALYLVAVAITATAQRFMADSHGPVGGLGHERSAGQGLHPLAALVARLLHRGEGGRDHEPHDQRHREPAATAPGRAGPVRGPGSDHDRHHLHPAGLERRAGPDHHPARHPGPDHPVVVVPRVARSGATSGYAMASPTCCPTCQRPSTASAS